MNFRLNTYRLHPKQTVPPEPAPVRGLWHMDWFLRGPVCMKWFSAAAALSGKAMAVGMILWCLHGMQRDRIRHRDVQRLRVSATSFSRALNAMSRAGLVSLTREAGKAYRFELRQAQGGDDVAG
jgi:hypothetical protein